MLTTNAAFTIDASKFGEAMYEVISYVAWPCLEHSLGLHYRIAPCVSSPGSTPASPTFVNIDRGASVPDAIVAKMRELHPEHTIDEPAPVVQSNTDDA